MNTKLSTKGQVVLPGPVRRRLGIQPGDALEVKVEKGSVVLTPRKKAPKKAKIIDDPVSGIPVITAGPNAPTLTSKQVEEMLANFP